MQLTKAQINLLNSMSIYRDPEKEKELTRRVTAGVSTRGMATWQLGICPVVKAAKEKK